MYNNWPTKCPYVQWLAYRVPICIINHLPGAHASTRLFSYQDPIIPPFTYQVPSVELRSPWQSNYFFSFSYKLLRSINDTPSVCLSVCLSVRVAVRLFACLSVCLPVYLPVRASDTQTCNDNTVTTRGTLLYLIRWRIDVADSLRSYLLFFKKEWNILYRLRFWTGIRWKKLDVFSE